VLALIDWVHHCGHAVLAAVGVYWQADQCVLGPRDRATENTGTKSLRKNKMVEVLRTP
jgi:hypothetical protein